MKSIKILVGVITLLVLFSFSNAHVSELNEPQGKSAMAFFPNTVIANIMKCNPCTGVRFYNALYPSDASVTLMAVSENKGADSKDALYHLYEGIVNNGAMIIPLHKVEALRSCENLGNTKCFAVTFSNSEMITLMNAEGASGIAFMAETDRRGYRTLSAIPANIKDNSIVPIAGGRSVTPTEPCPNSCGSNPQADYLCNMQN